MAFLGGMMAGAVAHSMMGHHQTGGAPQMAGPVAPDPKQAHATSLNYQVAQFMHGNYRLGQLSPTQNGSNGIQIQPTIAPETQFELGTYCWNLNRSFMNYEWNIPGTAGLSTYVRQNGYPWATNLYLNSRTGIILMEFAYANQVIDVINNQQTSLEELLTMDPQTNTQYPSNTLTAQNQRPTIQIGGGYAATNNYTEGQYHLMSAANTAIGGVVIFPLKQIKGSVCELDRDLLFGEVLLFRHQWAPLNQIAFLAQTNAPGIGTAQITATCTVNRLYLYLAAEQDSIVISGMREKLNAGFTFPIPFIRSSKALVVGANASPSYRFNRGDGSVLKRIFFTAWNSLAGAAGANAYYDRDNSTTAPTTNGVLLTYGASLKIQQYYTQINNAPIENLQIAVNMYQDWLYNKPHFDHSCIQGGNAYRYNWVHVNSFEGLTTQMNDYSDSRGLGVYADVHALMSGISLNNSEMLYNAMVGQVSSATFINSAAAAGSPAVTGLQYHIIALTRKILTATPTTTSCL